MTAPLWHFLNSDSGGVARYVERLAAAQCRRGDRPLRVAGSPALALPAEVRRDAYAPYRAVWGLNQWRFALRAGWLIARGAGRAEAESVQHYVAPVGEKDAYVARAFAAIGPYL